MWLTYLLFIAGFVLLIKGADWLVAGATSIARRFGLSDLIIGLTVVAFGTSAPELAVSLLAAFEGKTDVAVGNVLGSNISNILLILGLAALIFPLAVQRTTITREIPLSILAVVVMGVLANDKLIDSAGSSIISRGDGLALLAFFSIFIFYVYTLARSLVKTGLEEVDETVTIEAQPSPTIWLALGLVGVGLVGLIVGGRWVVDGAVEIATQFGLSQTLIGLTVVAIGTSLPELATSVVAALKKSPDIAVGNVIGSNIFNIFWILGLTATVQPVPFQQVANLDIGVAALASLLLYLFLIFQKQKNQKQPQVQRWMGGVFVAVYASYLVYLVIRG